MYTGYGATLQIGKKDSPVRTTRQALWFVQTEEFLKALGPYCKIVESIHGDWQSLSDIMRLPPGTYVTGLSSHLAFDRDLVAIRVSHPSFPETAVGNRLPEVTLNADRQWSGWTGKVGSGQAGPTELVKPRSTADLVSQYYRTKQAVAGKDSKPLRIVISTKPPDSSAVVPLDPPPRSNRGYEFL